MELSEDYIYQKKNIDLLIDEVVDKDVINDSLIIASNNGHNDIVELLSQNEFDRNVSVVLRDLNEDGRNEILHSEVCSGNGCLPNIYITWV